MLLRWTPDLLQSHTGKSRWMNESCKLYPLSFFSYSTGWVLLFVIFFLLMMYMVFCLSFLCILWLINLLMHLKLSHLTALRNIDGYPSSFRLRFRKFKKESSFASSPCLPSLWMPWFLNAYEVDLQNRAYVMYSCFVSCLVLSLL